MKKENWVWMPHAGHLCVSSDCQFHLNTYVGKYIVSTVGEYWPDRKCREIHAEIYNKEWFEENKHLLGYYFDHAYRKKFGFEEIGCGRKYETMVFKAKKSKVKCCLYSVSEYCELDSNGYNDAGDAYKGHIKMCNKWANLTN